MGRRRPGTFWEQGADPAVRTGRLWLITSQIRGMAGPRCFERTATTRPVAEANARRPIDVIAYCILLNHWHLVLRPRRNGDLSRFVGWLTLTHTQRWHAHYHNTGSGHLYQGRFKSFPVEGGAYFLALCRYVERNGLRAGLVRRAEAWRWCSLWR